MEMAVTAKSKNIYKIEVGLIRQKLGRLILKRTSLLFVVVLLAFSQLGLFLTDHASASTGAWIDLSRLPGNSATLAKGWMSVASSSDGSHLVAVSNDIWSSAD